MLLVPRSVGDDSHRCRVPILSRTFHTQSGNLLTCCLNFRGQWVIAVAGPVGGNYTTKLRLREGPVNDEYGEAGFHCLLSPGISLPYNPSLSSFVILRGAA